MKYVYIELNHYTRMPLSQGNHFSMVITNPIQMILGTNGSGKSSLVKELTPYPPNPNDYAKQGSKILKIEHNNKSYMLKTVFSPSTKHSFILDDENLNEGGTATVQKDLIKEHFNFSSEINDLLHDDELFTNMSPSRRKEWFISLCETDYSYAIKQYNKLKEKQRDCLGALKLAKKRLTSETEKTLKTEEEAKLHKEVSDLHTLLSHLLEFRKPVEHDTDTIDMAMDKLHSQVYRAAMDLQSMLSKDTPYSNYSLHQLEILQTRIQQSLSTLNAFLDEYTHQYNDNQEKIKILQQAEQNTIDSLQIQLQQLRTEKTTLQGKVFIKLDSKATVAYDSFTNVKSLLTEICTAIPANKDRKFSNEAIKIAKHALSELQIKKQTAIDYISNKQAQLKHLLSHKETQLISCIKCHHKFSLVYNEQTCSELETALQVAQAKLDVINKETSVTQAYIDECLEYSVLYRQYTQITTSHPILNPYWAYIKENNIFTDSPKTAIHLFNQFEQDLKVHVSIETLDDKILKVDALLDSLKDVGTESLQGLIETNKRLYTSVGVTTDKISSSSLKLNQVNKLIQRKKTVQQLQSTIEALLDDHTSHTKDYIETMRREALNALIRQLQSELGAKEHILHLASNQKSIIRNIEDQISELEIDKEALTILINQLSPTDGLIAQGLLGFIRSFVNQMNTFIENVWAYPMTIMSCDIQDNEDLDLDYKFPVKKREDGTERPTPDVSKCSNGMKEIINLSFKITAMKYLDLLHTPLYLDEFGAAMDNGHKNEVISLIKEFNEQKTFSQMFIVSHDVTQYNSLPNSEVCVLCDTNIITPQKYNEHVTMR